MLTDDELAAIEARAESATPGKWEWSWYPYHRGMLISKSHGKVIYVRDNGKIDGSVTDTEFIAHSRTDIERLLNHIRTLSAENTYHRIQLERCADELRRVKEKV